MQKAGHIRVYFSGIPERDGVGGNVMRHDAPRSNNGVMPNPYPWQDQGPGPDKRVVLDNDRAKPRVAERPLGARIVGNEHDEWGERHLVSDGDLPLGPWIDIHIIEDGAVFTDGHAARPKPRDSVNDSAFKKDVEPQLLHGHRSPPVTETPSSGSFCDPLLCGRLARGGVPGVLPRMKLGAGFGAESLHAQPPHHSLPSSRCQAFRDRLPAPGRLRGSQHRVLVVLRRKQRRLLTVWTPVPRTL